MTSAFGIKAGVGDDMSDPGKGMHARLTRRSLLALGGGTALALVCGARFVSAASMTAADFVSLSARLLEADTDDLDADIAGKFLSNLLASGKADALAALAGGAPDPALDQEIVTGWYSGVQQAASGEEVVTYTDALVWKALDYTKPQAWCGGETGYWALPPGEG